MSVQRGSQEVNLTPNLPKAQYTGPNIGLVSPNVAEKSVIDQKAGAADRTLAAIMGDAVPLAKQYGHNLQEEAYLEGASKAASGVSQEAIESNITTRDWANAGYRDTAGKLSFAQKEAQLGIDMKKLRGESPEQMQEYLSKRRNELLPSLEGMSREQRTAMLGKMVLADQSAIAMHTTEHMKFIIDQEKKPIQLEHATALAAMDAGLVSGSEPQYSTAMKRFSANLYDNMLLNPRLPDPAMREDLVVEAMKGALQNGHVQAYTQARDAQVPDGKGGSTTLLGMLSLKNQEVLSKAHYTAMEQTDAVRNLQHTRVLSEYEASLQRGESTYTKEDMYALQEKHARLYPKDQAGTKRIEDLWLDGQAKYKNSASIIAAAAAGNQAELLRLGSSDEAGVKAWHESMVKGGAPIDVQINALSGAAGKSPAAAKLLGSTISTALQGAIGNDGKISTEGRVMLAKVNTTMDGYEKDNKLGSISAVYSGMSEEGALRFQQLRLLSKEYSPDEAASRLVKLESDLAGESAASKAGRVAADKKAFTEYESNLDPVGFWGKATAHLTPFGRSANQAKLSPHTSWWSSMTDNSNVTYQIVSDSKNAVSSEAQRIRQINPSMPPEEVIKASEAAVLRRAVITKDAPLILPMGRSPQEFFGTNASVDTISQALPLVFPKTNPDNRMVYRMDGNRLAYTEFSKDGKATVNSGYVNPAEVKAKCDDIINKVRTVTNEAYGKGVTIPIGSGVININGDNTASISNDSMLAIRKNLLKFEGYTDKAMKDVGGRLKADGTPVMTSGFGVSDTNNNYKAEGTLEEHKANFIAATNEAARDAMRLNTALGKRGDSWTQLTTELVYQSGIGNVAGGSKTKQHPAYAALLMNKDPSKTIALVQATPAYKMSSKDGKLTARQKHYTALAQQIEAESTLL